MDWRLSLPPMSMVSTRSRRASSDATVTELVNTRRWISGMTDAIAVTETNRTTIYMRKTLDEPIEYIYFDSIFIAEEDRRSLTPCFDEIYYEISGVAQSVDDLLALLPIG